MMDSLETIMRFSIVMMIFFAIGLGISTESGLKVYNSTLSGENWLLSIAYTAFAILMVLWIIKPTLIPALNDLKTNAIRIAREIKGDKE